MWEIDLDKEERKNANQSDAAENEQEFDDFGVDLYDDFVIIERQKEQIQQQKAKIVEEEKIKDAGGET